MSKPKIGGILQVGIGVTDMPSARTWYHQNLNFSAQVLEERTVTGLMKAYTGGQAHERQAAITMNMAGAGGLEVWQYLSRKPKQPSNPIALGDFGIFAVKLKTPNIQQAHNQLNHLHPSEIEPSISGKASFTFEDLYENYFQVVEGDGYFERPKTTSGIYGVIIGCSDISRSIKFYTEVLGYELQTEIEGIPLDLKSWRGSDGRFKRAWLSKPTAAIGGFSKFLGNTEIELVQALDRKGTKIYKDRYWGDPGFIHVCYDVRDMDKLSEHCEKMGHPFVLDSFETEKGESFNMGKVTSRVAYIDDPDGTAIEFVETHKVPILPALGISINLQSGNNKDVPTWLLKLIKLKKVSS